METSFSSPVTPPPLTTTIQPKALNSIYQNSTIKFLNKDKHYELWFTTGFESISGTDTKPIFTQLLYDLHHADKSKELHIFISSFGGSCDALVAIMTQVNLFNRVVTVALGDADSCGFILWSCGYERYASPMSSFLHHPAFAITAGNPTSLATYTALVNELDDLLEAQTNISEILTPEEIELAKTADVWILGKELISRNACMDIATYKDRMVVEVDCDGYTKINGAMYKLHSKTGKFIPLVEVKNKLLSAAELFKPAKQDTIKKKDKSIKKNKQK